MTNIKRPLLTLALSLVTTWASAQLATTGAGGPSKAAYTGPGDVVSSAIVWYGLRAYNASYAAAKGKAFNLRRASDNATCDFDVATSGTLGVSDSGCGTGVGLSLAAFATQDATCTGTIASTTLTCASASSTPHAGSTLTGAGLTQPSYITTCGAFIGGAGTCTLNAAQTVSVGETITMTYGLNVATAYDQTGGGHNATQATAGNQPALLPSCLKSGALPCLTFNGSSTTMTTSSFGSTNQPLTFSGVAERIGNFTSFGDISITNSGGPVGYAFDSAANSFLGYGGLNCTAAQTDSVLHSIQAILFGSLQSFLNIDGTTTSCNAGNNSFGGLMFVGSFNGSSNFLNGFLGQTGLWGSQFTTLQLANMHANDSAYWGTP